MGEGTTLDVEESTEPPICGYKDPSHKGTSHLNCQPDTEEQPISHVDGYPALLNQPDKEPLDRNAHLIEPANLAILLQTDLRYVVKIDDQRSFLFPLLF